MPLFLSFACLLLICSCGSDSSRPLKELASIYVKIGNNNQELQDAFQAAYQAPREEQGALAEKASEKGKQVYEDNKKLGEEAAKIGEKLQGTTIRCEASEATGITIKTATFSKIQANENLAVVIITADFDGNLADKPYYLLMDGDNVVSKSLAGIYNGQISINLHINGKNASTFEKISHIKIVTGQENNENTTTATEDADASVENSAAPAEEPAYTGDDSNRTSSAGGIKVGDNLVKTLSSAPKVTYEYNADSGIWATIGNTAIVIDESQLNQKGIDFINSLTSDIVPDMAFKPEYVKPDETVRQIEAQ